MISCAFFADVIFAVIGQILCDLRARICTVGVHGLVSLFKQFDASIAVVQSCVSHAVIGYQLAVCVAFDVILVAEMSFIILFRPSCVGVLLRKFRRIFWLFPFLGYLTVLDLFVVITAVSLTAQSWISYNRA